MDARLYAKELARRHAEIVMVRSEEYQTKKEVRDAFTCFTLSYPSGSRLVLDPWGLLGHGETDNSEEALEAPFNVIGPEPMDWFMRDVLERNGEADRPDLTVDLREGSRICRRSYQRDQCRYVLGGAAETGKGCRYILGEPSKDGDNIIVIGINPNKADIDRTDGTTDIVTEAVGKLGAKGWVLLNLYPQRGGNPDKLPSQADDRVIDENLRAVADVFAMPGMRSAKVWAAWGNAIEKRGYFGKSLRQMVATIKESGHTGEWFQMGDGTAKRNPLHPNQKRRGDAFMPWNLKPNEFDVDAYLKCLAQP